MNSESRRVRARRLFEMMTLHPNRIGPCGTTFAVDTFHTHIGFGAFKGVIQLGERFIECIDGLAARGICDNVDFLTGGTFDVQVVVLYIAFAECGTLRGVKIART